MFGIALLPVLIRFSDYTASFYVANLRPPVHTITIVTAHSLLTADISRPQMFSIIALAVVKIFGAVVTVAILRLNLGMCEKLRSHLQ